MKEIKKQWKKGNYKYVYESLKRKKYNYTLDNLEKDFHSINNKDKYCYLIYLVSVENSVENTLLLCDFLLYIGTFFFDIHSVIHMFIEQSLMKHGNDNLILKWIISIYDNHPESPFSQNEINFYKNILIQDA